MGHLETETPGQTGVKHTVGMVHGGCFQVSIRHQIEPEEQSAAAYVADQLDSLHEGRQPLHRLTTQTFGSLEQIFFEDNLDRGQSCRAGCWILLVGVVSQRFVRGDVHIRSGNDGRQGKNAAAQTLSHG